MAEQSENSCHPAFLLDAVEFALNAAMSMGPTENCPALAFSVNARKYPPAELICWARCRMQATTIAAVSGPMTWQAGVGTRTVPSDTLRPNEA